ncbi:MAG: hypothetical protein BWK79_14630 [Beggiatoa sp. IS2]|nr:MAG: hypothetical protein BWK79_14630 [Beggiatoa sp. IS2]
MPIPRYKILILFSIFVDYPVYALEEFTLCRPYADLAPARPNLPLVTDEAIRVFADSTTMHEKQGIASFSGNVLLQRADQILSTPAIIYERNRDIVEADNDFTFWDKNFVISGKRLQLRPQHQGTLEDTTYWLLNRRGRGTAKKIIQENQDIVHLEQSSYTTCDPDNEMWRLNVHDLTLDNATATGTAYHVTVRFLNMPLFYMPYLSFPLDKERRSGFLPPSAGSSDEVGFEMSIPYYWNIAPNYDATLTPRFMTKRGILLKTEFRYLTVANGGTVTMEYLPNDRVSDENRSSFAFIHNGALTDRLTTDINFNYASDERYFEELGNNLSMASTTHLERRADLMYRGDGWDILGRLQAFQTLDRNPASRPYKRFPQLVFKTTFPERNRQLNTESTVELVRFDRDTDMTTGPVGERLDVNTSASWPWRTPGAFFVPKLSLLYTRYTLDNQKDELANNPSRALFRITADSGLFFERNTNFLNTALLQTLEPRLFYRYTPYKDQYDLPIFDTALFDLSFGQLFRDNRFNGTDRVDDGHQTALALTSEIIRRRDGERIFAHEYWTNLLFSG